MSYLFFAIICSSTIAFIFKFAEKRQINQFTITTSNYFIASVVSLIMIIRGDLLTGLKIKDSLFTEWKFILFQDHHLLSPYNSVIWGILIGGLSGFFFFSSFQYYQKSVKENGVGLSGTFAKLGILIPMIFSIIIWKEYPSSIQWIGIILALTSILIVNLSYESINKFDFNKTIVLLFLFGGIAEFSNKIYQKYALNDYKDVFLFSVFFVAFLISYYYTKKHKTKWKVSDVLTGFAVGIPNLFSSYFLILSLETLSTSVAFPIYSAGSIAFINLGGYFIFKEKISKKNKIAIGLILLALVLMNL